MKVSFLVGSVWMGFVLIGSLGAEPELPFAVAEPNPSEEMGYSYGTVKEVTPEKIVVSEYDDETGLSTDVSYAIDPGVVLENVGTVGEIALGDAVEIEYVVQGDSKVAKLLSVERPLPGEEADTAGISY